MLYRPWETAKINTEKSKQLQNELSLPPLISDVLVARGKEVLEAKEMVYGGGEITSPKLLKNIDKAVERILQAVDKRQRIIVFGDYDVDGVTATALLYTYLDGLGADVYYKLPSRDDDGYGLNSEIVQQLHEKEVSLIITVDNGICAHEAVLAASQLGIDVVITDHHLPPAQLPQACAIINPCLADDESPFKFLSGVGVAFKLICALEDCEPQELLPFYADLLAIGTVADIMELTGENREFVKAGLAQLQNPERAGIAALMHHSSADGKEVTTDTISFAIAPRLNAAGRMDSANIALELLLCDDEDEADDLAKELCEKNALRQKAEQDIADEIIKSVAAGAEHYDSKVIVIEGESFHQGVIGIVASRIVERFGKPAIIISIDQNGEGKGSGRSVEGISLYDAISACSDLLLRFGGHSMAAGLSIMRENIAEFRKKINQLPSLIKSPQRCQPIAIDCEINLQRLNTDEVSALSYLAPYGNGNPSPLFCIKNAVIDAVYPVSDGKHTRLRLKQGAASVYCVMFNVSPAALCYQQGDAVDAAVYLTVYEGKGGTMLSGRIKDLRPAALGEDYLDKLVLFDMLCSGAQLDKAQKAQLLPQRADTAAIYKMIAQRPVCSRDLRPVFNILGGENAGKTFVSLCALAELGLIQKIEKDGTEQYVNVPATDKKDLSSAKILCALEG